MCWKEERALKKGCRLCKPEREDEVAVEEGCQSGEGAPANRRSVVPRAPAQPRSVAQRSCRRQRWSLGRKVAMTSISTLAPFWVSGGDRHGRAERAGLFAEIGRVDLVYGLKITHAGEENGRLYNVIKVQMFRASGWR